MRPLFPDYEDEHGTEWINLQPEFERLGYQFRPRFRPGARIPPLILTGEDSIPLPRPHIIDAIRLSDGSRVVIKMVSISDTSQPIGGREEVRLTETLGSTPDAPVVPFLAKLTIASRPDFVFLVLRELVPWNVRDFRRLDEVLDFARQMLCGLEYLHRHRISHGDFASSNIMMDGLHLFAHEPHPVSPWRQRADYSLPNSLKEPTTPVYPKFYFIDLGLSIDHPQSILVTVKGVYGQNFMIVPEFSISGWSDPFLVDLWRMGHFLRTYVVNEYEVEMLRPLIESMMQDNPKARMSAANVLKSVTDLLAGLSPEQLQAPVKRTTTYNLWPLPDVIGNQDAGDEDNDSLSVQAQD